MLYLLGGKLKILSGFFFVCVFLFLEGKGSLQPLSNKKVRFPSLIIR